MFEFSVRPLYFGDETQGTLLGYVVSGYAIDRNFVSQAAAADVTFTAGDRMVVSTLDAKRQGDLELRSDMLAATRSRPVELSFRGERYLTTATDLSEGAVVPLRLVVLKSFDQANRATRETNRLVGLVGVLALLAGGAMMLALSDFVTRPLETLAAGVRAFGFGDSSHRLPSRGTREVIQVVEHERLAAVQQLRECKGEKAP